MLRQVFIILILFFMGTAWSYPSIQVYSDSVLAPISPLLFGTGDEMTDRLSGPGFDSLVDVINPPLLRMGGIEAEGVDWKQNDYNGISYADILDTITPLPRDFGLDSILRFCERHNIEPVLTVPHHLNDPVYAAEMVEYCNGETTTPMGTIRASRGHPEPYGVTYWCIGNEVDIAGIQLHFDPYTYTVYRHFGVPFGSWDINDSSFAFKEDIAQMAGPYCDSMRAHSPIPLKIGVSIAGNTDYIEPIVSANKDKLDWIDVHCYPCNPLSENNRANQEICLAAMAEYFNGFGVEGWYRNIQSLVDSFAAPNQIPVYLMEHGSGFHERYEPFWSNYMRGIYLADQLGRFARVGVPAAAHYNLFEPELRAGSDENAIRGDTLSLRADGRALSAYNRFFSDTAVHTVSNTRKLNIYASRIGKDSLVLFGVNTDFDSTFEAMVTFPDFKTTGNYRIWNMSNDTSLAAPFNGTKGLVYIGEFDMADTGGVFVFPNASLTIITTARQSASLSRPSNPLSSDAIRIFPNPFNSVTTLYLDFKFKNNSKLKIFNIGGAQIFSYKLQGNQRAVKWDARQMPNGIYILEIKTGNRSYSKTIFLLK
jgi:hypothetical protein